MLLLSPKLQSNPRALPGAESSSSKGLTGPSLSSCLVLGPCLIQAVICKHPLCVRPLRKPSSHGSFLRFSFEDGEMWTPCAVPRVTRHWVLSESSPAQTTCNGGSSCVLNAGGSQLPLTFLSALGDVWGTWIGALFLPHAAWSPCAPPTQ